MDRPMELRAIFWRELSNAKAQKEPQFLARAMSLLMMSEQAIKPIYHLLSTQQHLASLASQSVKRRTSACLPLGTHPTLAPVAKDVGAQSRRAKCEFVPKPAAPIREVTLSTPTITEAATKVAKILPNFMDSDI